MELGRNLAQARKDRGMTQQELAERLSVTRQTVSRWESGTALPDVETVAKLAGILQVSADTLLGTGTGSGEKEQPAAAVTRLLAGLEGAAVRIAFYEDEEDMDVLNQVCRVVAFEGSWMRVQVQSKSGEKEKLLPLSSVLSFELVQEGGQ